MGHERGEGCQVFGMRWEERTRGLFSEEKKRGGGGGSRITGWKEHTTDHIHQREQSEGETESEKTQKYRSRLMTAENICFVP